MSLEWILLGLRILATLILYTFLGVAFYIIWRDLQKVAEKVAAQPPATYQLRIMAVADNRELVGSTLPLPPVAWLGRDPDNTIVLEDTFVSDRHARLSQENGVWWLEDLGSQHGTRLNAAPLSKPMPLAEGDIIEIGRIRLRLEAL